MIQRIVFYGSRLRPKRKKQKGILMEKREEDDEDGGAVPDRRCNSLPNKNEIVWK